MAQTEEQSLFYGQVLFLNENDDKAQNSHQGESTYAQEPQHHPEEDYHHRLNSLLRKVHLCKAKVSQALVELSEKSPQLFTVVYWRRCCSVLSVVIPLMFRNLFLFMSPVPLLLCSTSPSFQVLKITIIHSRSFIHRRGYSRHFIYTDREGSPFLFQSWAVRFPM